MAVQLDYFLSEYLIDSSDLKKETLSFMIRCVILKQKKQEIAL